GLECHECQCAVREDEGYRCEDCENDVCPDCVSFCGACDQIRCPSCIDKCAVCEQAHCNSCLEECSLTARNCCSLWLRTCSTCNCSVASDQYTEDSLICPTCEEPQAEEDIEAVEDLGDSEVDSCSAHYHQPLSREDTDALMVQSQNACPP